MVDGSPDLLSPLGEVQRFVSPTEYAGGASVFIPFDFSPPLSLIPYEQYAIEWGGGSVSWYFSNVAYPPADPYAGGITWTNSGGSLSPTPERDFHFRTYGAVIDSPGNGGGIFNEGGEVFVENSSIAGNVAVGSGGAIYNDPTAEFTLTDTSVDGDQLRGRRRDLFVRLCRGQWRHGQWRRCPIQRRWRIRRN